VSPTIVILSTDPADVLRLRRALELLARRNREAGGPRPAIADADITHAGAASDRLEPSNADAPGTRTHSDDMTPLLLPVEEAARRLGLARRTVERLVSEGRINSRKIGARRMFAEDDLRAYVDSLAVDGPNRVPAA
jgi:excisionase family DNA binding protein